MYVENTKRKKVECILSVCAIIVYVLLLVPKILLPIVPIIISPILIKITLFYFVTKAKKQERDMKFKDREETYKQKYIKLSARIEKEPTIVPFPIPSKK